MKRLLLLPVFLLAGCSLMDSGKTTPSGGTASSSVKYACDSGEPVRIKYHENGLRLRYKGKTHHLKIALSASGARYAGDGLVWWNKGSENTLYKLAGKDGTGDLLERCREAREKK